MSIISDLNRLLKSIGNNLPEPSTQGSAGSFSVPNPTPNTGVGTLAPQQNFIPPIVNRPTNNPIQIPSVTDTIGNMGAPISPFVSGVSNLSQGTTNVSNIAPQAINSLSSITPQPMSQQAQSIRPLAENLGVSGAEAFDIYNTTAREARGEGFLGGLATLADYAAGIGPAIFETIEAPFQLMAGEPTYQFTRQAFGEGILKKQVVDSYQEKKNEYDEILGSSQVVGTEKIFNTIKKSINDVASPYITSENGDQQRNAMKLETSIVSEMNNVLGPWAEKQEALAQLYELSFQPDQAKQIRDNINQQLDSIPKKAFEIAYNSSLISYDADKGTAYGYRELGRQLQERGMNFNNEILSVMRNIDGTPVSLDQGITWQDIINNQTNDAQLAIETYDIDGVTDYIRLGQGIANKILRPISQGTARGLSLLRDGSRARYSDWLDSREIPSLVNVDDVYNDTVNSWKSLFRGELSLLPDGKYSTYDSLAGSDLGFLAGLSVHDNDKFELYNEYSTKIMDVVPEFATTVMVAMLGGRRGAVDDVAHGLKVNKGLNSTINVSKSGWIKDTLGKLGLWSLRDTMVDGVVDSYQQNIYDAGNVWMNIGGAAVGDLVDIVPIIKQATKIYSYDQLTKIVRESAQQNKAMELVDSGVDKNQAMNQVSKMTDEELVGSKIDSQYIDKRIKEVEKVLEINNDVIKTYQSNIQDEKVRLKNTTDPVEIEEINNNIRIINGQLKKAKDSFEYSLAAQKAAKRFWLNPTVDGALDYAKAIKDFLPSTKNQSASLNLLLDLPDNVFGKTIDELEGLGYTLIKSNDGGLKLNAVKRAGFDPEKVYNSNEVADIVEKSKNNPAISFIGRKGTDGEYVNLNKIDGDKYLLNEKGLSELNAVETQSRMNVMRDLGNIDGNQEKFLNIISNTQPNDPLYIPKEELDRISNGDIYTNLRNEIDEFIPCI